MSRRRELAISGWQQSVSPDFFEYVGRKKYIPRVDSAGPPDSIPKFPDVTVRREARAGNFEDEP